MISAPAIGCCASSLASKASAGGQLEQPSDVKSSKTTGTLTVLLAGLWACGAPDPDWQVAATIRVRAAGSRSDGCFMLAQLLQFTTYYVFCGLPDETSIAFRGKCCCRVSNRPSIFNPSSP